MNKAKAKKTKRRGVARHEIHWRGPMPETVEMTLGDGRVVALDLAAGELRWLEGSADSEKRCDWLRQIGAYLARQALLEAEEERLGKSLAERGQAEIDFEPQPRPDVIWWG